MILNGSHPTTVPPAGMFAIALLACLTIPAWSVGQDAGSEDENPLKAEVSEVISEADVEVVLEEIVEIEPVVVNVKASPQTVLEITPVVVDVKAAPQTVLEIAPLVGAGETVFEIAPPLRVPVAAPGGVLLDRGVDSLGAVLGAPPKDAGVSASDAGDARHRMARIEKNMERLEKSLQAVLAELKELRRGRGSAAGSLAADSPWYGESTIRTGGTKSSSRKRRSSASRPSSGIGEEVAPARASTSRPRSSKPRPTPGTRSGRTTRRPGTPPSVLDLAIRRGDADSDYALEIVTLSRATYKLPPGKAAALASFLRENVTAELDIGVRGDTVTITTSVEDQQTIGKLIRLLLPRKPRKAGSGVVER